MLKTDVQNYGEKEAKKICIVLFESEPLTKSAPKACRNF